MTPLQSYPKRLIEVDLPIARISAHARREKSIRHGHISTLHIWWARRPLAACRAVICASLWPDPADPLCPQKFRDNAAQLITAFARKVAGTGEKIGSSKLHETSSAESFARWEMMAKGDQSIDPTDADHQNVLRFALLDFIADFANWDNSAVPEYLETARALTQSAHESLGGEPGTRPLVVDPFAGGGSIPLEALRVGADAFASDLNPVAVLLNKVVLEYIPKYGQNLADEVRKWGQWVREQAEKELAEFYPKDPDGATPIAYLWARTIRCEGASCGAEVPLMRSLWLAKKANKSVAVKIVPNPENKRVDLQIINNARAKDVGEGTVKRGSATCPCCGFTTPVKSVREQLKKRRGGAGDARLYCVVSTRPNEQGRLYRLPTDRDLEAVVQAAKELEKRKKVRTGRLSLVPCEDINPIEPRCIPVPMYGMTRWEDLFNQRQLLVIAAVGEITRGLFDSGAPREQIQDAVLTILGLSVSKIADRNSSLCRWIHQNEAPGYTFGRQAIPMLWDYAENAPLESGGGWRGIIEDTAVMIESLNVGRHSGLVMLRSADDPALPNQSVSAFVTDPPYYYSIPYANLSDFFYVWLRRFLSDIHPALLSQEETNKEKEIIQNLPHSEVCHLQKSRAFYESRMRAALFQGKECTLANGIGVVVFAHTETEAWESLLSALISAEWCVTASWPIDTERSRGS